LIGGLAFLAQWLVHPGERGLLVAGRAGAGRRGAPPWCSRWGLVRADIAEQVIRLWPVVLIVLGLGLLGSYLTSGRKKVSQPRSCRGAPADTTEIQNRLLSLSGFADAVNQHYGVAVEYAVGLHRAVLTKQPQTMVEIGMANGAASLAILSALFPVGRGPEAHFN